jgi:hypothetical protein
MRRRPMAVRVTFRSAPGIALSPNDANKLRGEIEARLEAAPPGRDTEVLFPDFESERGTKKVKWKWVNRNGQDYEVDVTSMD